MLLAEHKWVVTVECTFRRGFNKHHQHAFSIRQWFNQFKETTCWHGRACEFQEHRLKLWKAFDNHLPTAPGNRFAVAVYKHQFQKSTLREVLRKRLRLHSYRTQCFYQIR
jgi:hypothetical protein